MSTHISLFSGIGALDLAVEMAGYETIATAEIDSWCRTVLAARNPHAEQGASSAGTAGGLGDPRSALWFEFDRVIGRYRPEWVLIENTPLLRSRGMARVLCDLAERGYDARWDCVPAASVGAPHLRDRIFIIASKARERGCGGRCDRALPRAGVLLDGRIEPRAPLWPVQPANAQLLSSPVGVWPTPTRSDGTGGPGTSKHRKGGKNLRTVVNEVDGNSRLNPEWVEWLMGLPFGWTDPTIDNNDLGAHTGWANAHLIPRVVAARSVKNRSQRIRGLGNAVVPQAANRALMTLSDIK